MEAKRVIKDILKENENIVINTLKPREFEIDELLGRKTSKIIAFTGFRRVGKTYLLFLIKERLKDKF